MLLCGPRPRRFDVLVRFSAGGAVCGGGGRAKRYAEVARQTVTFEIKLLRQLQIQLLKRMPATTAITMALILRHFIVSQPMSQVAAPTVAPLTSRCTE